MQQIHEVLEYISSLMSLGTINQISLAYGQNKSAKYEVDEREKRRDKHLEISVTVESQTKPKRLAPDLDPAPFAAKSLIMTALLL